MRQQNERSEVSSLRPILLLASLSMLYGCQPETPKQPEAATPVVAAAAVKPEAPKSDAMQLAKDNGCLACHAIKDISTCPMWKDIAAKYRGDKSAEDRLTKKIAEGGSGVWGEIVMPAHPQISEADRRTLVKFVLSL